MDEVRQSQKLIDILAQASEEIGCSLDEQATINNFLKLLTQKISDWAALIGVEELKTPSLEVRHSEPSKNILFADLFKKSVETLTSLPEVQRSILTGEKSVFEMDLAKWSTDFAKAEVLCVPLKRRSEVTHVLLVAKETPKKFFEIEISLVEELTKRAVCALENACLYQEARRAERELFESKKSVEEANIAKTIFLATMSHEIRTPISAILGFTDLLLGQGSVSGEQAEWAHRIRQNGNHLLNLIDDILNVSKIESGKVEFEKAKVYLSEIFAQLKFTQEPKAFEKGIKLTFDFETAVPDKVEIDGTRMLQILNNLIGNAIKFTTVGEVKISVRYKENSKYLIVVISDTGPGLTIKQSEKLFSPFSQADVSHNRSFGGTGLGLVVSRQLAQLMGGDVELLESQPGVGTSFQLALPLVVLDDTPYFSNIKVKSSSVQNSRTESKSVNLCGLKILVVDDSEDSRVLTSRILIKAGAEVITAQNGREGIKKALADEFSLVLMDMQMPDVDGIEATKELRQRGYRQPIIALTACALLEEKENSLRAGCDGHLTKPIVQERMLGTIADFCNQRTRRLEDPRANTEPLH